MLTEYLQKVYQKHKLLVLLQDLLLLCRGAVDYCIKRDQNIKAWVEEMQSILCNIWKENNLFCINVKN